MAAIAVVAWLGWLPALTDKLKEVTTNDSSTVKSSIDQKHRNCVTGKLRTLSPYPSYAFAMKKNQFYVSLEKTTKRLWNNNSKMRSIEQINGKFTEH